MIETHWTLKSNQILIEIMSKKDQLERSFGVYALADPRDLLCSIALYAQFTQTLKPRIKILWSRLQIILLKFIIFKQKILSVKYKYVEKTLLNPSLFVSTFSCLSAEPSERLRGQVGFNWEHQRRIQERLSIIWHNFCRKEHEKCQIWTETKFCKMFIKDHPRKDRNAGKLNGKKQTIDFVQFYYKQKDNTKYIIRIIQLILITYFNIISFPKESSKSCYIIKISKDLLKRQRCSN